MIPQLAGATVLQLPLLGEPRDRGLLQVRELAAQLPDPATLPSGTLIAIPDTPLGKRKRSVLERMTGRAAAPGLHRAARCTALIARGYVGIGGGEGDDGKDWAWGAVP